MKTFVPFKFKYFKKFLFFLFSDFFIFQNKKMKRILGRKVPEGELCAVCSDLATGYHYGVASCNGWLVFFFLFNSFIIVIVFLNFNLKDCDITVTF